jgi:hypothetical protein
VWRDLPPASSTHPNLLRPRNFHLFGDCRHHYAYGIIRIQGQRRFFQWSAPYWTEDPMTTSRIRQVVLPILLGMVPVVHAQEPPRPTLPLDCWISADDKYGTMPFIACIRDRGERPPADDAFDAPEVVALDTIHRLLHDGAKAELDRYVRANAAALQNGEIRRIRLFSYPSQWSWDEERPQFLAGILCPDGYDCPIFFRRWGAPDPIPAAQ